MKNKELFNKILSSCCLILFSFNVSASNALVEYESKTNKLSVHAENQPLRTVLTQIAFRTGLEILFDHSIKRNVSVKIQSLPLEKTLARLAKKTNYVFYYKNDPATKKQLLIGMKVLPNGKHDESALQPLVSKKGDFFLMKRTREDLKNLSSDNLAYARRLVRYNDLDSKQREKVDHEVEKIEKQRAKNKAERDKRYEATRTKSKPEPGADPRSSDEIMKEENPEFYERMMERRREIEARIIEQGSQ